MLAAGAEFGIIPCGLDPKLNKVTSLAQELGEKNLPSKDEIKRVIRR